MKYLIKIKISVIFIIIVPMLLYGAKTDDKNDYIEKSGDSSVNWSKLTVTTVGNGAFPFFTENYEVARLKTEKTAKLNACKKINTLFTQMIFSEKESIETLINEENKKNLKALICSKIKITDKHTFSDGSSDLYFSFDMDTLLKSINKFIEPKVVENQTTIFEGDKNLLVIEIPRKIKYKPTLFPKIISKSGTVLYSYSSVNENIRNQGISVQYYRKKDHFNNENYVKIKPVSVINSSDIIISDKDFDLLKKSLSSNVLNKGNVIIINN